MKKIIKIIQGVAGVLFLLLAIIIAITEGTTIAFSVICGIIALVLLIPAFKREKPASIEPKKSGAVPSNVAGGQPVTKSAGNPASTPPSNSGQPSIEASVTAEFDSSNFLDVKVSFYVESKAQRASATFWEAEVSGKCDHGVDFGPEYPCGVAEADDDIALYTGLETDQKPESVTVEGCISLYELDTESATGTIIAKLGKSEVIQVGPHKIKLTSQGIDDEGDLVIDADLSGTAGLVLGIRACAQEDALSLAQWDVERVNDDSTSRQITVSELESAGTLINVDIAIGKAIAERHAFSTSASVTSAVS